MPGLPRACLLSSSVCALMPDSVQRPIVLLGNLAWAPKGLPAKCIQSFAFTPPRGAAVRSCVGQALQAEGRTAAPQLGGGEPPEAAEPSHGADLRQAPAAPPLLSQVWYPAGCIAAPAAWLHMCTAACSSLCESQDPEVSWLS